MLPGEPASISSLAARSGLSFHCNRGVDFFGRFSRSFPVPSESQKGADVKTVSFASIGMQGAVALALGACTAAQYQSSPPVTSGEASAGRPPAEATLFAPGVISTDSEEYRISFAPDGKTAYFSRSLEFFREPSIYETRLVNGAWTEPRIAPFSGEHSDIDPAFSPDGRRLYFSSHRPVDGAEQSTSDVWVVERENEGWGEPRNLGPTVNSQYSEDYASVDAAGNLYVASSRPHAEGEARKWGIWMFAASAGGFQEGVWMGPEINTQHARVFNFNPAVSPDGEMLVFTRLDQRDSEGTGYGELFVALKTRDGWTEARNIGPPANTALDEFHPSFSPDGQVLFFVRRDPKSSSPQGDLFSLRVEDLVEPLR